MPRYEYKCKNCGKSFEAVHGIEETVDECRFCGGDVRKVFHPVGIVFKGPGFYSTDSRVDDVRKSQDKGETPSKPAAGSDSGRKKKEEKSTESAPSSSSVSDKS